MTRTDNLNTRAFLVSSPHPSLDSELVVAATNDGLQPARIRRPGFLQTVTVIAKDTFTSSSCNHT